MQTPNPRLHNIAVEMSRMRTPEELKRAYKLKYSLKLHPNKNPASTATENFQELQRLYEARAAQIRSGYHPAPPNKPAPRPAPRPAPGPAQGQGWPVVLHCYGMICKLYVPVGSTVADVFKLVLDKRRLLEQHFAKLKKGDVVARGFGVSIDRKWYKAPENTAISIPNGQTFPDMQVLFRQLNRSKKDFFMPDEGPTPNANKTFKMPVTLQTGQVVQVNMKLKSLRLTTIYNTIGKALQAHRRTATVRFRLTTLHSGREWTDTEYHAAHPTKSITLAANSFATAVMYDDPARANSSYATYVMQNRSGQFERKRARSPSPPPRAASPTPPNAARVRAELRALGIDPQGSYDNWRNQLSMYKRIFK